MTPRGTARAVVDAVREIEASTVVVGLPLSLSGEAGPAARAALEEAAALRALLEPLGVLGRDGRRALHDRGGASAPCARPGAGARRPARWSTARRPWCSCSPGWTRHERADRSRHRATGMATPTPTSCRGPTEPEPAAPDDRGRATRPMGRAGERDTQRAPGGARGRGPPAPADRWPSWPAACSCVVLAFVLWYELESHALGPAGPQVVVTVHEGESTSSVISSLSAQHVIGSSLAFQISDFFHGTPTVLPGSYALHQNLTFAEVRAILRRGPEHLPGRRASRVHAAEVAAAGGRPARPRPGSFEKAASSGVVHSAFSPPGSNNLEGMLGTGQYLILPGETDTTHPAGHGAALRPRRRARPD